MDTKKKIMPQINSEEQPIKFKSGTIAGKGSKPRPGIYTKEYRDNFDKILEQNDNVFIFGEDVGKIGDVNQGLEGLQKNKLSLLQFDLKN